MGKKDTKLNPAPKETKVSSPEKQAVRDTKVTRLLGLPPVNQRELRRPRS